MYAVGDNRSVSSLYRFDYLWILRNEMARASDEEQRSEQDRYVFDFGYAFDDPVSMRNGDLSFVNMKLSL